VHEVPWKKTTMMMETGEEEGKIMKKFNCASLRALIHDIRYIYDGFEIYFI
jgi:hypothetical protein